jgi:hypothetical protein
MRLVSYIESKTVLSRILSRILVLALLCILASCGTHENFRRALNNVIDSRATPNQVKRSFSTQLSFVISEEISIDGIKLLRLKEWTGGCHVVFYFNEFNGATRYEFLSTPESCTYRAAQLM